MARVSSLWRNLVHRDEVERDLDAEMRATFHMLVDEKVQAGMPLEHARRAATLELGGMEPVKEQVRGERAGAHVDAWFKDIQYTLRLLRRAPGFGAVAVATLALGIGSSTAIFTVVDTVLLRPLRFAEPERLVMVWTSAHSRVSAGYLHDWRRESRSFADMAGWRDVRANLTGRGEPLEVAADRVTPNFFDVLGAVPHLGRTFTVSADLDDIEPEVVLSHGLWQRRFGGDPSVIGQPITLDSERLTIIGVMPDDVAVRTVELSQSRAELWMPFALVPGDRVGMGGALNVVGRLAPDATIDQARAELVLMSRRIEQQHPSYSREWGVEVVPLLDATVQDIRVVLLVLLGAVGILLLIACTNVANLVLSRAMARQTEWAIRLSIGATAGRLFRQCLTEGLVLAFAGGTLGVLLAVWGVTLFVPLLPAGLDVPRTHEIGVDVRILAGAFLVTLFTAMLFGLVPVLSAARYAPHSDGVRASSPRHTRNRAGSMLIVSEVALALILLAGAGLLGRSFWALSRVNAGFRPEQVVTMRTTLPASKYDTDGRIRAFSRELLQRVENVSGVRSIGFVNYLPMSRIGAAGPFEIVGRATPRPADQPGSWTSLVGGEYFEAMGIPLLRGRLPGPADTEGTAPVFVIDETLANRHWPNEDPIGAHVTWSTGDDERLTGEVVGVVGSVRWRGLRAGPQGTTYFWFPQNPDRELNIVVRTAGDPIAVAGVVAAQIRDIDPIQPVAQIRALEDLVSADLAQPRFTMLLLGSFAVAALLLAAIGLYGVIVFNVARRTREIGIRVALGAQHADLLRLVMRRGILLTGTGLAIGTGGALALGRVVAGLLYGVTPADPATLIAAAFFLAVVAMLATYLPARRAARVDPMMALRAD